MKFFTPSFYALVLFLVFCVNFIFAQNTSTFSYNGGAQTFIVPCGVYNINLKAWGAGGSGGGADTYIGAAGGGGAYVQSDLAVTPGQVLTIVVGGGAGPGANCASSAPGGTGGWGNAAIDGGRGGNAGSGGCSGGGGGGGGGTAVVDGTLPVLVAGGGGGGSGGGNQSAGGAGGGGGQNGIGSAGSCTAIGIAGASTNGQGVQGGDRGPGNDGAGGGGGGGGFNGGTGGAAPSGCDCGGCGGGGGNSWTSGTNIVITNGNGQTPGNNIDPLLPSGLAAGGYNSAGGNGFVAITYNNGIPVAAFSNSNNCLGGSTPFTDNSTVSSGTLSSWNWDFGDGNISTFQNPYHTYTSSGIYTVTLIVTSSVGCTDTATGSVEIFPKPVADFDFDNECFGDQNSFTDQSQGNQNWDWNFGDGIGISSLQNPVYTYSNPGNYNVTLIVTTGNNCTDTIIKNVLVYPLPVSQFSVDDVCLSDSAIFNNSSSGSISSWSWNFGDGSPVDTISQNPKHKYANAGTYTVTLINNSMGGCSDTAVVSIVIFPMPLADFSLSNACLNVTSIFNDLSQGNIVSWDWDFNNDGIIDNTSASPSHTYANSGNYMVSLTVTTADGCTDDTIKNIIIHPLPVAMFTASSVCLGTSTKFQDNSNIGSPDSISNWLWNFDNGSPNVTFPSPVYLYSAPGTYNVELLITSNNGCKDSLTIPVTVHPNPTVSFFADDTVGCSPLCANFQDFSSIVTGSNQIFLWDFGDGITSNDFSPSHCYTNSTNISLLKHSVSLTITSNEGCTTILTKNDYIQVNPLPVANFNFTPQPTTIANPLIYFQNQSQESVSWEWNFGDSLQNQFSNEQHPYYTFTDTGHYTVTLIAENNYSCTDTIQQMVVIGPDWAIYIPNAFTPNDDGINDLFFAKGYGIIEFEMLIFDRWGEMIFSTTDMEEGWDGANKKGGTVSQQEVYVYLIKIRAETMKLHKYTGSVTIIR